MLAKTAAIGASIMAALALLSKPRAFGFRVKK